MTILSKSIVLGICLAVLLLPGCGKERTVDSTKTVSTSQKRTKYKPHAHQKYAYKNRRPLKGAGYAVGAVVAFEATGGVIAVPLTLSWLSAGSATIAVATVGAFVLAPLCLVGMGYCCYKSANAFRGERVEKCEELVVVKA